MEPQSACKSELQVAGPRWEFGGPQIWCGVIRCGRLSELAGCELTVSERWSSEALNTAGRDVQCGLYNFQMVL